jgi:membrane protease YdiL (CAAX protease family)
MIIDIYNFEVFVLKFFFDPTYLKVILIIGILVPLLLDFCFRYLVISSLHSKLSSDKTKNEIALKKIEA